VDDVAPGIAQAVLLAEPRFEAPVPRVDVRGHAGSDVDAGYVLPDDLARAGVVHACAGMAPGRRVLLVFVDGENLEARTIGIMVGGDHRIAVPVTDRVEPLAVVVD